MKVFISHAYADKVISDILKGFLVQEGFTVESTKYKLQTVSSEVIQDGNTSSNTRKIHTHVMSNFDDVDIFIPVITNSAFKSSILSREFSVATVNNKKVKIIALAVGGVTVPNYFDKNIVIRIDSEHKSNLKEAANYITRHLNSNTQDKPAELNAIIDSNRREQDLNVSNKLKNALNTGKLTLMCGAGTSYDAGIPAWGKLLENLFKDMVGSLKENGNSAYDYEVISNSGIADKVSSLILAKYIKNNLGDAFYESLRSALYKDKPKSCDTISAIIELSRPQRDRKSIDSIITFNFDGLIEEGLSSERIPHKAIYSESIKCNSNELAIYHVHGYLPREGDIPKNNNIVFSEDGYHSQFIEPFSWSNIIQLQKLTQNTCLLIGISLTDPNMRRLLDVAWRKTPDEVSSHFMIKRKPNAEDAISNQFTMFLEEQDANALGIHIIWVDAFDEIPPYLLALVS